ncbi:hypothetical protein J6590_054164 [Homalodisca vitripennis]|nr:hypothetical protein J6590_054164 [Homalodisca vitripennis]
MATTVKSDGWGSLHTWIGLLGKEPRKKSPNAPWSYALVTRQARVYLAWWGNQIRLSMNTFKSVESTLQELHMNNCTVSLDAFYRLTNLRVKDLLLTDFLKFL